MTVAALVAEPGQTLSSLFTVEPEPSPKPCRRQEKGPLRHPSNSFPGPAVQARWRVEPDDARPSRSEPTRSALPVPSCSKIPRKSCRQQESFRKDFARYFRFLNESGYRVSNLVLIDFLAYLVRNRTQVYLPDYSTSTSRMMSSRGILFQRRIEFGGSVKCRLACCTPCLMTGLGVRCPPSNRPILNRRSFLGLYRWKTSSKWFA